MSALNPALLLQHFDRISEAPDAIARLRRFILDLAVRGKLVEQDPSDEPASELLKRIQIEKTNLMEQRRTQRAVDVEYSSAIDDSAIPCGWSLVHIADVARIQGGKRLPAGATFSKDRTPHIYIRVTDMKNGSIKTDSPQYIGTDVYNLISRYTINKEDIYITIAGTIGQVGRVPDMLDGQNLTENAAKIVFRGIDRDFLVMALSSELVQQQFKDKTKQTAQPKLALKRIAGASFPLPPLAEQHRIVAKVDELMALCDELEATQAKRESRRDRLVAGSLHRLSTPKDADEGSTPDAFRDHARFVFSQLPRLTTRPAHIKQLRQTILNLAVRGKLVEQDPNDEPAAELLKRLLVEQPRLSKTRLAAAGCDKACVPCPIPFFIPSTWQWVTLKDIICFGPQNGISPKPSANPEAPRAITLTATTSGTFNPVHFKKVDTKIPLDSEYWLKPGDLLFQRGNTREYVGIAAYYDGEPGRFLYPDLMMKVRLSDHVSLRFIHLCAVAPYARAYFAAHASGAQATMPKINQGTLLQLPISLPPLTEQHRIVAKVDELMTLCDQLESQLTTSESDSRRLLEAVLHEALSS